MTRFSKVSLFSDLNFLTDLTLDPRYSAVCGYTEADLDRVFAPELPGLDRARIRAWYNGYNWRGDDRVYNPWAILHLFDRREFAAHWFETTPRLLIVHASSLVAPERRSGGGPVVPRSLNEAGLEALFRRVRGYEGYVRAAGVSLNATGPFAPLRYRAPLSRSPASPD